MQVVRRDQLPAVLGDDTVCKPVGAPAPTAYALRRLVKLNGDARALQQLSAPEAGQPRADHEDADTIVEMAHPGHLRAAADPSRDCAGPSPIRYARVGLRLRQAIRNPFLHRWSS